MAAPSPNPAAPRIGRLIDEYLRREKITNTEMTRRIFDCSPEEAQRRSSSLSGWRIGRIAPTGERLERLAALLGMSVSELLRPETTPVEPFVAKEIGPARRALVTTPVAPVVMPPARAAPVFRLALHPDGELQVVLDVRLPSQRGMALARYLMDFGLVSGEERETDG